MEVTLQPVIAANKLLRMRGQQIALDNVLKKIMGQGMLLYK